MEINNCLDGYIKLYEDTLMSIYDRYFKEYYSSYEKFLKELKKHYNLISTNIVHEAVGRLYKVSKV